MNDDALVASALLSFSHAREFQRIFPDAEHNIVEAQRDLRDGWKTVTEWISRANLHDRYMVWLVVAVEVGADCALQKSGQRLSRFHERCYALRRELVSRVISSSDNH